MAIRGIELLVGLGFAKQADIATSYGAANFWRTTRPGHQIADARFRNENNATYIGKAHEFATQRTKSHVEGGPFTYESFLSSQLAAWAWAFALGKVVKTGEAAPYTYTCTPIVPAVDGTAELPYFSYVEQLRSPARDVLLAGCAVKSVRIQISKGPGKANAQLTIEYVASGKQTIPSAIVLPAELSEDLLNAAFAAITINGVNYTTAKTFESCEIGWDNAFVDGFYPGSGSQDGYQIQGRFEIGNRVPTFNFVARYQTHSDEIDKVRDLTEGAATVDLTADEDNSMVVTYPKLGYEVAELDEADTFTVVKVTGTPMYDSVGGVFKAVVKTPVDGICEAAA